MKTLSQPLNHEKLSSLEAVRADFEHWRATRKKFGPIPEELWSAAVDLTESHPVTKVSQALRLNYTDLRKRVRSGVKVKLKERSCPSGTVKSGSLSFVDLFDVRNHTSKESNSECSMEIRDGSFRLKMQCRGEAGVDLLELCRIVIGSR